MNNLIMGIFLGVYIATIWRWGYIKNFWDGRKK